jgi:hypothetical protein
LYALMRWCGVTLGIGTIDLAVALTAPSATCLAPGSSCRTQHESSSALRLVA